jgi:hypothetical protein
VTIFLCTQSHVLPDECIGCGGWLHTEQRGGCPGPVGNYCTEDCASDDTARIAEQDERTHLTVRDLICACPVCVVNGHPTAAEITEYHAYLAGQEMNR